MQNMYTSLQTHVIVSFIHLTLRQNDRM
uniref:Uncharacterized protein n=1 Tax=Anguilla anguilla TaxID=7936 RepID=A0A0E9VH78_ANGAN